MNWRKTTAGLAIGGVLATGGTVAVDEQINPYEDKGASYELSLATSLPDAKEATVEVSKDEPAVTLSKWGGEAALTVKYAAVDARGKRAVFTDRVEWKGEKEEVHAYPLEATAQMEDGGFELEIVLNEPPSEHDFAFEIEGVDELDFLYQSPDFCASEGISCPENVVGSYAVYHKTKRDHVVGETNYATGKAFHIFRPKAIDTEGKEIWGDLHYANGVLSVSINPLWLEYDAVYPVRVDPTFGYTTIGASTQAFFTANQSLGVLLTVPADFSAVVSISSYGNASAATVGIKGYFMDGSGTILANGVAPAVTTNTSVQWWTNTYVTPPTTVPSASVNLGLVTNGSYIIYGDFPGGNQSWKDNTNSYATPQNTTVTINNALLLSLYATYTTAAAPAKRQSELFFD